MVFEDYVSSWFSEIAHVGIIVDRRFRVCFAELKMGQAFCPLQNVVSEAKPFQSLPNLKFFRLEAVVLFCFRRCGSQSS